MSQIFGDTRQVAYVVPNMQAALRFFVERAGIGPWFLAEKLTLAGGRYRGTIADVPLAIALANSGGLQFELIQPLDETPSIYRHWLAPHPAQRLVQHYSSWVENYEAVHAAARTRGLEPVFEGRSAYGPFVYFAHPDDPQFMFEVTAFTPPRKSMFAAIAAAAHNWDGRDPVRTGWPIPSVG